MAHLKITWNDDHDDDDDDEDDDDDDDDEEDDDDDDDAGEGEEDCKKLSLMILSGCVYHQQVVKITNHGTPAL